jgi:hypothetical protein
MLQAISPKNSLNDALAEKTVHDVLALINYRLSTIDLLCHSEERSDEESAPALSERVVR